MTRVGASDEEMKESSTNHRNKFLTVLKVLAFSVLAFTLAYTIFKGIAKLKVKYNISGRV